MTVTGTDAWRLSRISIQCKQPLPITQHNDRLVTVGLSSFLEWAPFAVVLSERLLQITYAKLWYGKGTMLLEAQYGFCMMGFPDRSTVTGSLSQ